MARLDVYTMPGRSRHGYLVDVQANFLDFLDTRVVIPLLVSNERLPAPVPDLNPVFEIDGSPHVLATQAVVTVSRRDLRSKVASLDEFHGQITRAMDILLLGF